MGRLLFEKEDGEKASLCLGWRRGFSAKALIWFLLKELGFCFEELWLGRKVVSSSWAWWGQLAGTVVF